MNGSRSLPQRYTIGDSLVWDAPDVEVSLFIELPFWLMIADCALTAEVNGCTFQLEVKESYFEMYMGEVLDSRNSCFYIGPANISNIDPALLEKLKEKQIPFMPRKCKTVLKIFSKCNQDVLNAWLEGGGRASEATAYLTAFCAAHLPIVNKVIQSYRCLTYDYFPYELSPWDAPIWFAKWAGGMVMVPLLPYVLWDTIPPIVTKAGTPESLYLTTPGEFQGGLNEVSSPGELELLDALNLMERGDYSGAVRRVATSIEVILEWVLRAELLKKNTPEVVEQKLTASRNDFPGRQRQYEKLCRRVLPEPLKRELESTRELRHRIVHAGHRIAYAERGVAHQAVDTGRWIYNWYENDADKKQIRETKIALRSVGTHFALFQAVISPSGVVVRRP